MAQTISPVVHGGKRHDYRVALLVHTIAATLTGAAIGALLGAAGDAFGWGGPAALFALGLVSAVLALREIFRLPLPLPALRRQVPEWWRAFFAPPVAAGLYGAGLAVGFLTHLYYGTLVAVAAGALLAADPAQGALIYGTYGLARGASLLAVRRVRDQDELDGVVDALEARSRSSTWRHVNAVALVALTASCLASIV